MRLPRGLLVGRCASGELRISAAKFGMVGLSGLLWGTHGGYYSMFDDDEG